MKYAEFEEREFEAPLYNVLGGQNRNVWAPGQVLEQQVGFDYSLYTLNKTIFYLNGLQSPPHGAVLSRRHWPTWPRRPSRNLPNFKLNLFIQAKRPQWGNRPNIQLRNMGIATPYWKFQTDSHQQAALSNVALTLKDRALVVYAAPAFHTVRNLYRHTRNRSIVEASTFPSVTSLTDHTAWYYSSGGATGVANPSWETISEPSLERRIDRVIVESRKTNDSQISNEAHLTSLSQGLDECLQSEKLDESARLALYFERTSEIERDFRDDDKSVRSYLKIVTFCDAFNLSWYVLSDRP